MPTREAIVDTVIPHGVEKPLPVRVVSTRAVAPKPRANADQSSNVVASQAAVPAVSEESVRLSPQLTAIARKEQALQREREALKKERELMAAQLADAEKFTALKSKLTAKDFSEAESLGLSYDAYTEYKLNEQAKEDPNQKALLELREKISKLEAGKEEESKLQFEATKKEYTKQIAEFIDKDPSFPLVKKLKRQDSVLQLILDDWETDETETTIEQASKEVEEILAEEKAMWLSLDQEEKAANPPADTGEKKTLPPPKVPTKTLTQNMLAGAVEKKPVKPLQYMSETERYAEARRRVLERRAQQGQQ